jgi:predicted lipid-binding transport protein (Tim44 family)
LPALSTFNTFRLIKEPALKMSNPVIEVLILAGVALFVLWRLYVALGKGGDERPMQRPSPAPEQRKSAPEPSVPQARRAEPERPSFTGPAAGGLEEIYNVDQSFTAEDFLRGAKAAYTMIVGAYARGDRAALRPLLDDDVYQAWDAAITERDASGERAFELLRIKRAEIDRAELETGSFVAGTQVLGGMRELVMLHQSLPFTMALVSIPAANRAQSQRVLSQLSELGIPAR